METYRRYTCAAKGRGGISGQRRHYSNLEALRGIAALLVVLHHLSLQPGSILAGNRLLAQSWLFVDLFFVLSGFVIASVHATSQASGEAASGFLIRRLFRLYPLHLATLLAALALDVVDSTAALPGYPVMLGLNLAMVHSWGLVPGSVLNGPSWSISAEWAAYCLFAVIALVAPTLRQRLWVMAVVGLASLGALLFWRGGDLGGDLLLRVPRCLMSFALGTLVWGLLRDRQPLTARIAVITQLAIAMAMGAALMASASLPLLSLAMPLLSAMMIAAMVCDPGSVAARWLDRALPQWLGQHSYSLYMVHMPLFGALMIAGGDRLAPDLFALVGLALLALVSAATFRWIERPWREKGRTLARTVEQSRLVGRDPLQLI